MTTMVRESRLPGYLSLLASVGTLLCCALPAMFVLVGLGATVASVLSALPLLVALSRHKDLVFGVSGLLIAVSTYYVYRLAPRLQLRRAACPPGEEQACVAANCLSRVLLLASAGIYVVGFVAAHP